MSKSYFERAKNWIENADDVDIEQLEATITRFSEELKKTFSNPIQDESKIKDLQETLSFLREELRVVAGVDELPSPTVSQQSEYPPADYEFDSSPLVDFSSAPIEITPQEKALALSRIKQSASFISGCDLLAQSGKAYDMVRNG